MDVWQLTASALGGGALGAAITKLGDVVVNIFRTRAAENRADDAQEFTQQEQLFSDLRARIVELEKHTIDCLKTHAETNRKLGHVEGRLDEQTRTMQHIQQTAAESSRKAVETAGEVAARSIVVAAQIASGDSATRIHAADAAPTEPVIDSVHG